MANLAPATDTSSGTLSTNAPAVVATSTVDTLQTRIPDENFLDVSYSTDGQTWISIGKVNANNWQQFTITLPISSWVDLTNLQVRVEGIPTTENPVPPIYLDGMFVEVHYDVPPAILSAQPTPGTSTSSLLMAPRPSLIEVSPNVTITPPPLPDVLPTVPPPTITDITKTTDHVTVTVQYAGDFYEGNPMYLFVYPDGTLANRNDADSAFTFSSQPTEGPSINAVPIIQSMLDLTSKQATITIVEPVTPDDSEIATGAMVPMTYAVDVSYFDSQTWHLVPAQTFTWP
jgi:hypothetical protein